MVLNSNGTFIETNNYTAIPTGSSTIDYQESNGTGFDSYQYKR
jgi:hypothetical protein